MFYCVITGNIIKTPIHTKVLLIWLYKNKQNVTQKKGIRVITKLIITHLVFIQFLCV